MDTSWESPSPGGLVSYAPLYRPFSALTHERHRANQQVKGVTWSENLLDHTDHEWSLISRCQLSQILCLLQALLRGYLQEQKFPTWNTNVVLWMFTYFFWWLWAAWRFCQTTSILSSMAWMSLCLIAEILSKVYWTSLGPIRWPSLVPIQHSRNLHSSTIQCLVPSHANTSLVAFIIHELH